MDTLKRTYFSMLSPAVAAIVLARLNRAFSWIPFQPLELPGGAAAVLFVLAAVSAAALPVFMRAHFASRVRHQKHVSAALFFRFQHRLLMVVLITPYLALMTQFIHCPRFFGAATILTALYGIYYYYPSLRRIHYDRRLFRVQ